MKREGTKEPPALDLANLPALPDGWCWTTVRDLARPGEQPVLTGPFGSTLGREDFIDDGVPLLTIGCLTQGGITLDKAVFLSHRNATRLDRYRVRQDDILFSRSASVGRAGVVGAALDGSVINYHLMRLRLAPTAIQPTYFVSFVRGSGVVTDYLRAVNHGATRDGINTRDLLGMPVALAPAAEQRRIMAKVDELVSDLDAGVSALVRVKANLKRYRAAVLKAAVEGKLTERWRAENSRGELGAELLARILKERRRKWEADQLARFATAGKTPPKNWRAKYQDPVPPDEENLRPLPDGWCWASVQQLGHVQLGRQRSPRNRSNQFPTKYIRAANITEFGLDVTDILDMEFVPRDFATYRLVPGDVLLSEASGSPEQVGKPVVWRGELDDCCFQNTVIRLRPHVVLSDYLLVAFRHFYFNKVFAKVAAGVGINHLSAAKFSRLAIPLAPLAEQRQIVAAVEFSLSLVAAASDAVSTANRRAARLRQSILKRAFEGKLVAQDAADEPAAVLLARIQAERQMRAPVDARPPKPRRARKPKVPNEIFFRRAAIVAYTIKRLSAHPSFGRTQLEKTLHLAQTHLGLDLGFEFERYAAGPFDDSIYKLEAVAAKKEWFTKKERKRFGVTYHPGPKIDAQCEAAIRYLGPRRVDLDRLLDQMAKMNTDQAELLATVYAAWNDLLLDGCPCTDDAIIAEVYGWHETKKKFTRAKIRTCLAWMRKNGYVPTGKGRRTKEAGHATKLPSKRKRRDQ